MSKCMIRARKRTAFFAVLFLCVLAVFCPTAKADGEGVDISTTFSDDSFRAYVADTFDTDNNGYLSQQEIADVTYIDVQSSSIGNLDGIGVFTSLEYLDCSDNSLTELNLSGNSGLKELKCSDNSLTSLNLSQLSSLERLDCSGNSLGTIEYGDGLTYLNCSYNLIENLDLSGVPNLESLDCTGNPVAALDLTYTPNLHSLTANYCSLSGLDVSVCPELQYLYCYGNQLTILDISSNSSLTSLECGDNQLQSLDLSAASALDFLSCQGNQLTSLDVSECGNLRILECGENQLTDLSVSGHPALEWLYCGNNQLTSLDLSGNTGLAVLNCWYNSIPSLDVSDAAGLSELYVSGNGLSSMDLSENTGLTILYCADNELGGLNLENNAALTELYCSNCGLTLLDLSSNPLLQILDCRANGLTSLNLENNQNLCSVVCSDNALTQIALGANSDLRWLQCENPGLAELDVTGCQILNNAVAENEVFRSSGTYENPNGISDQWSADSNLGEILLSVNSNTRVISNPALTYSTVSFITNGGTEIPSMTTLTGYTACSPEDPTKENAMFLGWYLDGDFDTPFVLGYYGDIVCEDIELYARWDELLDIEEHFPDEAFREYISTYDSNGDGFLSSSEIDSIHYIYVSDQGINSLEGIELLPEVLEIYCNENNLTSLNLSGNAKLSCLNCFGNAITTLDISEKPELSFLNCSGNAIETIDISGNPKLNSVVTTGMLVVAPDEYNDDTSPFDYYWCDDPSGVTQSVRVDSFTVVVTDPETMYYTVAFDTKGGSEIPSVTALNGSPIVRPESPVKEGAEFVGWYSDEEFTEEFSFGVNGTPVTDNMTIYAKWNVPIVIDDRFPDEIFREYVRQYDFDGDGIFSSSEIQTVTYISVWNEGVTSLEGIEVFTELETLNCPFNQLTTLNLSGNPKLMSVDCSGNSLTSITVAENSVIETLLCYNNQLSSLPLENLVNMTNLSCHSNQFTTLDVSGCPQLVELDCSYNQLTELNVSANTALEKLNCQFNELTDLVLGENDSLSFVNASVNCLESLDLQGTPILATAVTDNEPEQCFYDSFSTPNAIFECWMDDGYYRLYADSITEVIVTPALTYRTVTFDSNGGSQVDPLKILPGHKIPKPDDPEKEDWVFYGWYSDPDFKTQFSFCYDGTPVTEDMTLYARWYQPVDIATHFPDEVLQNYVRENADNDGDGILSGDEIASFRMIDISGTELSSLGGIEVFYNLDYLSVPNNRLTSINTDPFPKLQILYCYGNAITGLNTENNPLLEELHCAENLITELDVHTNTNLFRLECRSNPIETLNISGCLKLNRLICYDCGLGSLDIRSAAVLNAFVQEHDPFQDFYGVGNGDDYREILTTVWSGEEWYEWVQVDADTRLITDPELVYYTVTFDSNGGSEVAVKPALPGHLVMKPDDPVKEGWVFYGWFVDREFETEFRFGYDGTPVTEDMTLYARWYQPVVIATHFPDEVLQNYLRETADNDGDGILSADEIAAVHMITISLTDLASLEGIEVFTNLENLSVPYNRLTNINTDSFPDLKVLYCYGNAITGLNTENNPLLEEIICHGNLITELDVHTNTNLIRLDCYSNPIETLNISGCSNLNRLICYDCGLGSLDIRSAAGLNAFVQDHDPSQSFYGAGNGDDYRDILTTVWSGEEWYEWFQVDADTRVIADPELGYYTVTFDSNGGSEIAEKPALPGHLIMMPEDPVREGATFIGWFASPEDTESFRFGFDGTPVMSDITLTARWFVQIDIQKTFKDEVFREVIMAYDQNDNGLLDYDELRDIYYLDLRNAGVTSLEGIEVLTYLTSLYCNYNSGLTSLNLSSNLCLQTLECDYCGLTSLIVPKTTSLTRLTCSENEIQVLDVSGCTGLEYLDCTNCGLTELDTQGMSKLQQLICFGNSIGSLNLDDCVSLSGLYVTDNPVGSLNLANCPNLTVLSCDNTGISTLEVSACLNLEQLYCRDNALEALDVSGHTALSQLHCSGNRITQLNLSGCSALSSFSCNNNPIESLDISDCVNLVDLEAFSTALSTIDVSNCTALNNLIAGKDPAFESTWDDEEEFKYFFLWNDDEWTMFVRLDVATHVITDPAMPYYTITFDSRGGSEVAPFVSMKGVYTVQPEDPVKEDSEFIGWFKADGSEFIFGYLTEEITSDLTVYAKWSGAPVITVQPAATTQVVVGGKASFVIEADSSEPLTYQWQTYNTNTKQWVNSGAASATTANFFFTAQSGHNGKRFRCVVTDPYGRSVISEESVVTIVRFGFSEQPADKTVSVGSEAEFSVAVDYAGTVTYQWQAYNPNTKKWVNSSSASAKTANLKITASKSHNGFKFRCVVKNESGVPITSDEALLTVNPVITTQPKATQVIVGETAAFSVVANGAGTLTYQWQAYNPSTKKWSNSNAASAKTATLNLKTVAGHNGFKFRCIVTDGNGNQVISEEALLTVKAMTITTQPKATQVFAGEKAAFSVVAKGSGTLTYQWQAFNPKTNKWVNSSAASAKTANFSITATAGHNGFKFRCVITDAAGNTMTSEEALLTVKQLTITTQPKATQVIVGEAAKFGVVAEGSGTLTYQWQAYNPKTKKWVNSSSASAKTANFSITATAGHNGFKFRCIITDANGNTVTSEEVLLTVAQILITTQPKNSTVTAGEVAKFTIAARGTGTLTYQWQAYNASTGAWTNSSAASAKTASFSFKAQAGHNGKKFRCIVTDGNGNQTVSDTVTLTVK